jgi:D-glycero-alpha-D-manno-heptose-7-phosphate kinase
VRSWVKVQAPVRVFDAGGWTDTWFSGHGMVCHLAVQPGAEVFIRRCQEQEGAGVVQLHLPAFATDYPVPLDEPPGHHPMLEAALRRWAPAGCLLDVTLSSPVPPGSSLGTSASVLVALVAALQAVGGGSPDASQLARSAHEVETVDLGRQSGVQDQVAAAFGGANFVTIAPYPDFEVRSLEILPQTWASLNNRVMTVYLGGRHDSSAIHSTVIERLGGENEGTQKLMQPLRVAAERAATALVAGDLEEYGEAMIANTEGQSALHPGLISPPARDLIELARENGAIGWKVNGAGGHGGTVTFLSPEDPGKLRAALEKPDGLVLLDLLPTKKGAVVTDQG